MSSSFSVVVLCPNGRRENVKVTPNSSILQIIEQACSKQKLNPENHELRHYNRILDPSLPVRFSSLPNNAFIELRPTENSRMDCLVTVALQLESGERITADFPPTTSLFEILESSLKSESICIDEIGEPACIYMRQKITGDAIKSTTLRSLGLTSGKAIIRLLYRKPEELESQAHVTSPLTAQQTTNKDSNPYLEDPVKSVAVKTSLDSHVGFKEKDMSYDIRKELEPIRIKEENVLPMDVDNKDVNSSTIQDQTQVFTDVYPKTCKSVKRGIDLDLKEEPKANSSEQDLECDIGNEVKVKEEIGDIIYIGGRHAVVYCLDDITSEKTADLPDEFFDLTINDAKYLLAEYQKQRVEMENQPLLTKEQRDRQILQRLANYSRTVIRVKFPEKLVLQAVFMATETIQDVKDFVRNYLDDRDLNFYLYATPPKEILIPSKSLIETMLIPAALIHFGCDIQLPFYLVESLRNKVSDPRAATLAASSSRIANVQSSISSDILPERINNLVQDVKVESYSSSSNSNQAVNVVQSEGKVPKWLKLSKK